MLVVALLGAACGSSRPAPAGSTGETPGTLVVFAAASLKGAFTALAGDFERAHPGARVVTSFGGSDSLAAQIAQGAPVDVFASADTATMATVTRTGDAKAPAVFATNELEIAVQPGNPRHIGSLADAAAGGVKLALCAPGRSSELISRGAVARRLPPRRAGPLRPWEHRDAPTTCVAHFGSLPVES